MKLPFSVKGAGLPDTFQRCQVINGNLIRLSKAFWLLAGAMTVCSTSLLGQDFVWTQRQAPSNVWQFVTSSSDGTILMAGANFPPSIYVSTNSGATWTKSPAPVVTQWYSGASSSDGTKLVATDNMTGGIYRSTNTGLTWTRTGATNNYWESVASSADGTKLVAAADGVYTSTNSGATWTKTSAPVLTPNVIHEVASSADGTKLVAVDTFGHAINLSTNSGLTWTQASVPAKTWRDVASSADGTTLVAIAGNSVPGDNGIYASTNSGLSWWQGTGATEKIWYSIASSSDGTKLAAIGITDGLIRIHASTNSGFTWIPANAPTNAWVSVASSADGTHLVAVAHDIYTAHIKTNPPSITQQPVDLATCPDGSSVLAVTTMGTQPLSYQWRRDGTNLVDGSNLMGSESNVLVLLHVTQSDSAKYDVVITNVVGCVTSSITTLFVTSAPAKATPIVVNGFVVGAVVTDFGCGYTDQVSVVFSGEGGSGASGYVQISNGSVTNIVITSAGFGYPSNTLAQVSPPFSPEMAILLTNTPAAAATPIIVNGFIVGANLTAPGSDYTEPPPVKISDVSGNGATAYTEIDNGSVTNIIITSAGLGYSSSTIIDIPPAGYRNAVIPHAGALMPGLRYQLQTASYLNSWTDSARAFTATNNTWASTDFWNVTKSGTLFFRLRILP